jgi:hypothetical protein
MENKCRGEHPMHEQNEKTASSRFALEENWTVEFHEEFAIEFRKLSKFGTRRIICVVD